tara:strand:- start:849 stop:1388 length:540 start_codon:yes stop_codon:yes gene_type:complete
MKLEEYSAYMQKVSMDTLAKASKISLLILDVDGVLTDGGIYIDEKGEESKKFYAQDGHGLLLIKNLGIEIAIISGRFSKAVEQRGKELGIKSIIQNSRDKLKSFDDNFSQKFSYSQTCFVGDDIVDSDLLSKVGLSITVPNSNYINFVNKPHWITPRKGGRGAVRDVCDLICIAKNSVK